MEKYKKVQSVDTQIMKQQVKNEQIKRKQTCSVCLVNMLNSTKTSSKPLERISKK